MLLHETVKRLALRVLPEGLLGNLKKIHYARKLRGATEFEEPDLVVVRHLVRRGSQVIDVGANFGLYTRFLSELVGPTGHVFSLEPVPLTFQILSSNVRSLGLTNVETYNLAISDDNRSVEMVIPCYASGGENFYEARIVPRMDSPDLRRVEVEARELDTLFGHLRSIDFIKCDVEGHELNCLLGASEILRKAKPAWLLEISSDPDDGLSSAYQAFLLLEESGYEAYWYDGEHLRHRQSGDRSNNYFFLTRRHVAELPKDLMIL